MPIVTPGARVRLQAELESVQSAAASREVELKFEIDRARQGRKELETRFAGLDPHKMATEDHALAQVKEVSRTGDAVVLEPLGPTAGGICSASPL